MTSAQGFFVTNHEDQGTVEVQSINGGTSDRSQADETQTLETKVVAPPIAARME